MANQKRSRANQSPGAVMPYFYETDSIITYVSVEPEPHDPCKPEKELIAAALVRLIQDATGNTRAGSHASDYNAQFEAHERLLEKAPERPFSFEWMCHTLELDPDYLRRFIKQAPFVTLRRDRTRRQRTKKLPVFKLAS